MSSRVSWWYGCLLLSLWTACGRSELHGGPAPLSAGGHLPSSGGAGTSSAGGSFTRGGGSGPGGATGRGGAWGRGGAAAGGSTATGVGGGATGGMLGGASGAPWAGSAGESGAGAGGNPPQDPRGWFVDALRGSDSNPGTERAPLLTLAEAARRARAPQTIWLLEGPFEASTEPGFAATREGADLPCGQASGVRIPAGVDVSAFHRPVVLKPGGPYGLCVQGSALSGLVFERVTPFGSSLWMDGGIVELRAVRVTQYTDAALLPDDRLSASLRLRENVDVRWFAEPRDAVLAVGPAAALEGTARLQVSGGEARVEGTAAVGAGILFRVEGESKLSLEGMRLVGGERAEAAVVMGRIGGNLSDVRLANSSVEGFYHGVRMLGPVNLAVKSIRFSEQRFADIYGLSQSSEQGSLRIEQSSFSSSNIGVAILSGSLDIDVLATTFVDEWRALMVASARRLSLDRVEIFRNAGEGVFSAARELFVRRTVIDRSSSAGIIVGGSPTLVDLGTGVDPGDNVFASDGPPPPDGSANIVVRCQNDCLVRAAGNVWTPDVQGADATGRYQSTTGPLEFDSGTGANYSIEHGTLRVAE